MKIVKKKLSKEEEKLYRELFEINKNDKKSSIMDKVKTAFK